jgi:hypothetical protein
MRVKIEILENCGNLMVEKGAVYEAIQRTDHFEIVQGPQGFGQVGGAIVFDNEAKEILR